MRRELDGVAQLYFRTAHDLHERYFDSDEGQRIVFEDVARFLDRGTGWGFMAQETWITSVRPTRDAARPMTLPPDARTTYDATDPAEDAPLAHKHALARAVKRVIELERAPRRRRDR